MPLPIAHGLMGAAAVAALHPNFVLRRDWRFLLLGAGFGICPDFDYLLNWIRFLGRGWHHDFTHSILFALLLGSLSGRLREGDWLRAGSKYAIAILTHPLLDYVYTDSRGVELFWPFSNRRFALGIMPPIEYSFRHHSFLLFLADLLGLILVELFLAGSVLATTLIFRRMFQLRTVDPAARP
jgi:membrane-bound metal-dependent hydrolase YbcI (DUF457 family)